MKKLRLKKRRVLGNTAGTYAYLYYGIFALCALLYIVMGMATRGDAVRYSLFYAPTFNYQKSTDMFMDFFNSVRDASHNGGYEKSVIYPPLANLIYVAIGKMFKSELVAGQFKERFELRDTDPIALMVYFVSVMLCVFAVYLIIDRYLQWRDFKAAPAALAITSALSFPMLYAIQRGNIIILAIPLTMFFVFFRNHDRKLVRELSYIALALAAGLKIYPAVFGILLITDKKYKEAIRLVIYGIIAFAVPIFAFGGPELLWKLVTNIFHFNSNRSGKASKFVSGYSFQELISVYAPKGFAKSCGKIVFWCLEVMALLMVFILPKDWQKMTALCYMIFNIRSLSSTYALTFFLVPFVMFLTEKRKFRWNDYLYLLCLALMFIPLPCVWYGFLGNMAENTGVLANLTGKKLDSVRWWLISYFASANKRVSVFAFQGVFLLLVIDALLTPNKSGKKRKLSLKPMLQAAMARFRKNAGEIAEETQTAEDDELPAFLREAPETAEAENEPAKETL